MSTPKPEDVYGVLQAVDRGEVGIMGIVGRSWADWGGRFVLTNGWVIEVFNDCGEWDYVSAVRPPGAAEDVDVPYETRSDIDDTQKAWNRVFDWTPAWVDQWRNAKVLKVIQ